MPVLSLGYVLVLVGLVVLTFPLCAFFEFRAFDRKRRALEAAAARSPLPIDDGPLAYDGHSVPTLADIAAYSFGDEMLAPVRERLS